MAFGFQIEEAEVAPGTLGLLYDDTPQLTTADVRPFIWAILLFRGAVKRHEVVGAITPMCAHSELYSGFSEFLDDEDDRTRLEYLVDDVLGDMVASGLLRYSMKADLWVLNSNDKHLPEVIKAVAGINGSLPHSYIAEREGL
tara:strand:+ start:3496 stop:3921 length:426 start_codon:yes stop_codon:yes gene_type:complete